MSQGAPAFLAGLDVLEAGDGIAGSAATAILASLGATVTKLVVATAPDRQARPALADGRSLQALLLDDGKTCVAEEDSVALLDEPGRFDVVVCDRVAGPRRPMPGPIDEYLAFVDRRNPGVWVTISAAGMSGPSLQWVGSELTVAAAGGLLSAVSDPRRDAPVELAGRQALLSAGQAAALAACHGLDRAHHGARVHVDVSAQEAVIATGPVLRCVHALLDCVGDPGARRYGAPAGFYPCRDGIVRISAMENHQWHSLVNAFGSPAWAAPFAGTEERTEHAGIVDARLAEITATMTKRECEELLQRHGVPATAMSSPHELVDSPQLAARHAIRTVDLNGASVVAVGPPATSTERAAPSRAAGLAGARVVEVGHVLAVPLAGALLGAMGAHVVKLEDPERLDMYRRRGPYIDGVPGIDRAAYFACVNHSKENMTVSLDDPDTLASIVEGCDVVLENLGPGRARRLGVDAAGLGLRHPRVLAVSSSGFGHTGPWAGYRAYAYNLHTACGLGYLTRTADGEPADIDMAWADLISAYGLATIVAAWAVGPAGRTGASLDFSMAELITARLNEYLAAASCGLPADPPGPADRRHPYAPRGTYPASGGARIALSVASDAEWGRLRSALGDPVSLRDGRFTTAASRSACADALDAAVGAVTAGHDAGVLAGRLQDAGVAASAVLTPGMLIEDRHLAERGFFTEVDHPVWGRRRLVGIPWRVVGDGPLALGPPPLLGPVDAP